MTDASKCPFCEIVAGRAPAAVVREWSDALAIVPLGPVTDGHLIVLPKAHVPDARDPLYASMVIYRAAELAAEFHPSFNLITSVGREATQSVFHLHLHIVPRRVGDGLPLPWTPQQAKAARGPKFEARDRVKVRHPGSVYDGWSGAVYRQLDDGSLNPVVVILDGRDDSRYFAVDELERIDGDGAVTDA